MGIPRDRTTDTGHRAALGGHQLLGWLSGLGLLVVPWVVAGVLATAVTMVRPESWDAEQTFPWLLAAGMGVGLAWVAYGSHRLPGFRRGALPGTLVALLVVVLVVVALRLLGRVLGG